MNAPAYLPQHTHTKESDELSEFTFDVANDYPFLEGHFPGNPIVPAVTQIGWCIDAIAHSTGQVPTSYKVSRFKFTTPLPPAKCVRLQMTTKGQRYSFKVIVGENRYSNGTISITTPAS